MDAIQLEFNLENKSPEDMQLYSMQKQVDQMCESMGKVRKKLFAELGEMKKMYSSLKQENEDLKTILKELKHERTDWIYGQNGCLVDISELKEAIC